MKLKNLLLGSAAAMMTMSLAVSGASAAGDADEQMNYVKVCDTYGSGFFYIPGTETCLRISGEVRAEYTYTDTAAPATGQFRARARLVADARNETDWGTLRSVLRIEGTTYGGGFSGNAVINRAYIQLGGFLLGYQDSFFTTNTGYGWRFAANDGYYDFNRAMALQYTFKGNGFSATIGVQDMTATGTVAVSTDPLDPYAGASYAGSWGSIAATVIYDSSANEAAWNASVNITAIQNVGIKAWYMADSGGTSYVTGNTYTAAGSAATEWQWGVDVSYAVNSQFTVWAGYTDADARIGLFGVGARWNPVSGLSIRPEAVFGNNYTQVRLRVVRSF